MHPVKTFHVRPALPERLTALEELAYNLRWSWDHETISLFRRLDRPLWEGDVANPRTGYHKQYGPPSRPLVAYFSLESGLTESLPI